MHTPVNALSLSAYLSAEPLQYTRAESGWPALSQDFFPGYFRGISRVIFSFSMGISIQFITRELANLVTLPRSQAPQAKKIFSFKVEFMNM